MAVPESESKSPGNGLARSRTKRQPLHEVYSRPLPIRTFPLPTFYPSNPLSLIHIAYVWLNQTLTPPALEPCTTFLAIWDPATRSVHVTDHEAVRALWEQGFYGKGNLSRSEPNWLKREEIRQGIVEGDVSEQRTASRREERRQTKWDRARSEQEAIDLKRTEEASSQYAATSPDSQGVTPPPMAPIGPLELLGLPNSLADLHGPSSPSIAVNGQLTVGHSKHQDYPVHDFSPVPTTSDIGLANKPPQDESLNAVVLSNGNSLLCGSANGNALQLTPCNPPAMDSWSSLNADLRCHIGEKETEPLKHRKSVRFSSEVESTTFQHTDPPSPNHSAVGPQNGSAMPLQNGSVKTPSHAASDRPSDKSLSHITDIEHLQLSPEEAFFLAFGLGTLAVQDPRTNATIPTDDLLTLFRQHSHFPPLSLADSPNLQPQDSFLVHYAVYHHFRSLGWVPRHGVKFGVDWLLYQRGPVFDHAEFGLIVLPSFPHAWWKEQGHAPPSKTWKWLHGVNRVLSHVLKSLVLVYVDIPPPPVFEAAMAGRVEGRGNEAGISAALKHYVVREIMVRRWSSNRNR